ncbi:hypothetical protein HOD24_02165, partial [Candidatus Peregrinibacteria bacterium]|nr:hypothetical protein [Candidatus Peregrinibacteria bacterium]
MLSVEHIDRIDARDKNAANRLFEIIRISLGISELSRELLAKVKPGIASQKEAELKRAKEKLHDIGIHCATKRIWKGMRMVTDVYSQIDELLNEKSVHKERIRIFSTEFDKPLHFRDLLTITGATAGRTYESNRKCLENHFVDRKIRDSLQIAFTLNGDVTVSNGSLEQGWVGSEEGIRRSYEYSDNGHIIG